jgi:hypothetical protein
MSKFVVLIKTVDCLVWEKPTKSSTLGYGNLERGKGEKRSMIVTSHRFIQRKLKV